MYFSDVIQECREVRADIVFVVDSSKAYDDRYWQGIKQYFVNLASSIYGGHDGRVRVCTLFEGNIFIIT